MQQLKNLADDRLINGCIYCGGHADTRDHVPSRVFLDSPYPENLPVVGACSSCNNGFSLDEEYVACMIECARMGSTDPDKISRSRIAHILIRAPALRTKLESAVKIKEDGIYLDIEVERVKNVILKLARGHSAFELSHICREEPDFYWCGSFPLMSEAQKEDFNASHVVEMFGEIGSRNLQRLMVTQIVIQPLNGEEARIQNVLINDWVDVQEGAYRYLTIDDDEEIKIKIVIGEYLISEVVWKLNK